MFKMTPKLICAVLLGAFIFNVCKAATSKSNEEEARKFAKYASKKIFDFYNRLVKDAMAIDLEDYNSIVKVWNTIRAEPNHVGAVIRKAIQFDHKIFKDEELRYIFERLTKSGDISLLENNRFSFIIVAMFALRDLAGEKYIDEGYKNVNVLLTYFPDIENIFAESNDPEELKFYWNECRKMNSIFAMPDFLTVFDGYKDAAALADISASEFWMKDYNLSEMDAVINQIEPFYRQLHAFLRKQLNEKYGDSVIQKEGLIPDHLFQQVLAQAWTDGSVMDQYFPFKDLPPFDEILEQNSFDTIKLFKTADNFFKSMGFEPVPDSYWGKRLKIKSSEDKGDCTTSILTVSKNVFMQYCNKMDFKRLLQAHGNMAEIYYALEKSNLPAYYFGSFGLEYAVGKAVILSASSPKHLNTIGLVPDFAFTQEVLMNRLVRLNIHTMINIYNNYVQTKVITDLFSGKIEMSDLNARYWQLMEKHVGVGPSDDPVTDTYDFPYKFYSDFIVNKQARNFNSEVLSYQMLEKFCSTAGHNIKEDLHNCDFYGSKEVGSALKKMMKLGSSRPFHEVLATITPEDPKLNAESLLEYFLPASSWFMEANMKNNIPISWTYSN